MLPDNTEYNFKGIIDEVKLFNYALTPTAAATLYQQSVTALKESFSANIQTLKVAPNPTTDRVTLSLPFTTNTKVHVQVQNAQGQLVLEKSIFTEGGQGEVNTSQLISGVYIVSTKINNQTLVARFVKL